MADKFNQYQRTLLDVYEGGDFADINTEQGIEICGDGLLKFLFVELSDNEDCTDDITAFNRIDTAISQMQKLRASLDFAWLDEGEP